MLRTRSGAAREARRRVSLLPALAVVALLGLVAQVDVTEAAPTADTPTAQQRQTFSGSTDHGPGLRPGAVVVRRQPKPLPWNRFQQRPVSEKAS